MSMLWDALTQLALAAAMRPGRAAHDLFHHLAVKAAALVVAMVLGIIAVVCAVAGALILWAPPLDAPHLLFILAAGLMLLALLTWLVICKGKGPHQLVSEALDTPTSPFDEINNAVHKVTHAFNRGWHSY